MAFKMACAETGAKCPFEVTTPTRDELMEHVMIHAKMAHPELAGKPMPPDLMAKLIHEV